MDYTLISDDLLTKTITSQGVLSWNALLHYVSALPYGRNKNRKNPDLVLLEKKGTCSSKHAFLKKMADLNNIPDVTLLLGMYKMNQTNTPGIGTVLTDHSLNFIPEAHCYLKIGTARFDGTTIKSDITKIEKDILIEKEIRPEQVATYKVAYHKTFLKDWIEENNMELDFETIWMLREKCIKNLTG
ncbi:hypothetical protein ACFSTE_16070 [Aquimarina hainanensis]|uniref:Uncharacterized protein n=2 Tax=Aquimarina hainanensis TaxID=1578017 RepID=A0ABW5NB85_9FLAO